MKIEIIKCLKDNYAYLIIDETNQNECVVDPSEAKPVISFVENNFPNIIIIKSKYNRGFAGGCNYGAQYANGKYLLIINL